MLNWHTKGRSLVTSALTIFTLLAGESALAVTPPQTSILLAHAETQSGVLTAEPGSAINLRSAPDLEFNVLHTANVGQAVTILETQSSEESTWYRVLVNSSGARGWVRSDLVVQGADAIATNCHSALASARGQLNALDKGFLRVVLRRANPLAPSQRPYEIAFVLGGEGQGNILSSPQFMLAISTEVLGACSPSSSVRFASDSSGAHDVDGLIDGQVKHFKCVELTNLNTELRWGEAFCEL